MPSYCLRIDVKGDEGVLRSKVVDWIVKQGHAIGCYECPNDNPHYHIWLDSDKQCKSIRQNFKYNFKEHKGNGSYSIVENEGNLNYICKGESVEMAPIIIINTKSISDVDIAKAHEQYWIDKENYESNCAVKKKKATEVQTPFRKAFDYCKEKGLRTGMDGWEIVKLLINYYRDEVKCEPNDFQLKNMAKSIASHLVYEYSQKNNRPDIYDRYLTVRARQIIGNEWHTLDDFLLPKDRPKRKVHRVPVEDELSD